MAITLTLENRFVLVDGADLKTTRAIERLCSYKVAGYYFSPAFRQRRWDGKEHLFKFSKKRGYHAPAGLAEDIAGLLKGRGLKYRVVFATKLKGRRRSLKWAADKTLRGYQKEAVKAMLGKPIPGRGCLKMPIRSGKTRTVAKIIQKLGRPTLFVVPSKSLLYQTIKALGECLPDAPIGQIGDSVYDPKFITVATIQTLAGMAPVRKTKKREGRKADPRYLKIMNAYDLGVFDESHHLRGQGSWYQVFVDLNARFKIGVSATIFFDSKKEQESGIIWLKATCGPIRYTVSEQRLIDEGYLHPQEVRVLKCSLPVVRSQSWSATLKRKCITENQHRNRMIAEVVASYEGRQTIIIAKEHKHIAAICEELDSLSIDHRTVTGRDKQHAREDKVEGMVNGDYDVLVGNVLGEGIDIPTIEIVVNAEGGHDEKNTWQRQRNLTAVEDDGKEPILIDFMDLTSKYFEKHSKKRLKIYRSIASNKVTIESWPSWCRKVS